MKDLWAALSLVAVLEGLFLFAAPEAWKRAAARMLELSDAQVRRIGSLLLLLGLLALWGVRGSG